jgi:hypothetical protein
LLNGESWSPRAIVTPNAAAPRFRCGYPSRQLRWQQIVA